MFFLTVSFISLELTEKFDFVFSFQFLLICILPRFIQWTYCPQTLKEVTYSIYIQCWSWNYFHTLEEKTKNHFCVFVSILSLAFIFYFQKSWKNKNPNQEYWGVALLRFAKPRQSQSYKYGRVSSRNYCFLPMKKFCELPVGIVLENMLGCRHRF